MSDNGDPSAMPRQRFPEFRGQALREVQLKDVTAECTTRNGALLSATSVMGVTNTQGIVPMKERLVAADIARYKIVRKEWFAYNPMRLNIGSIARWQGDNDILVSPDYVVFRCLDDTDWGIGPSYLDHFRNTNTWRDFVADGGDGSVRIRIYYKDIAQLHLVLPCVGEQKKIADCLTSLDDVIAAQAQKVAALMAHKRGLMQQLFPREGEMVPRLRFAAFRSAPEWDMRELGALASKVGSGSTPLGGERNYKTDGRPFVRSQNVGWGELLLDDVVYIDEETHRAFDATEIKERDVLLNITGASIGRSAIADSRIARGNVNQHVCIIRVRPGALSPELLSQYLVSDRGQKQIDSFQTGGNRQGLNFGQIRSFAIPLPPDVAEQQQVADCLTSTDASIAAESRHLAALRAHKAGLMQQLFPSSDPD